MFHRFHAFPGASIWQGALSPEEFERILRFVGTENILLPAEWIDRARRQALRPNHLCVTFDDGLRSQIEHALPVLDRHGLKAFWFVYSCVSDGVPVKSEIYSYAAGLFGGMQVLIEEFLQRCPRNMLVQLESEEFSAYAHSLQSMAPFYTVGDLKYRFLRNKPGNKQAFEMLMDQIIADRGVDVAAVERTLWFSDAEMNLLAETGHLVGLHSYDHPYNMGGLGRAQQQEQYERNYAHIMAATGQVPICMSHPLNSYNHDSLTVLAALGIECGFRANAVPPSGHGINPNCLELAREDSATLMSLISRSS
jgi:peptidoglycan/xylan/chitin deacetylase (PgdA/CDA1 family)